MAEGVKGLVVVLSTFEDAADAAQLARTLVEERLIACGNFFPGLTSIYWWEGKIEEAGEVLLLMKTRMELVSALKTRIAQLHPYEVPEVLVLPVADVAEAYGQWVMRETTEVNG